MNPIVPAEMSATLRLLKKDFTLDENCNSIRKYLVDVDKFVVVGVIGRQGVGKSAVAALLAQSNLNMDPKYVIYHDIYASSTHIMTAATTYSLYYLSLICHTDFTNLFTP